MNYRRFTSILAVCSISLSVFGCSVKEAQTETSETSEAVITEESELPSVSVTETETETVIENETSNNKANYKFSVEFNNGDLKSITQYDDDGNEEIKWQVSSSGLNYVYLYNTAEPELRQFKKFETDYNFETFENKDLHFLFDGIDTESAEWEDNNSYLSVKTTENSKGNTVSRINVYLDNDNNYITQIFEYEYNDHDSVIHEIITTYGSSKDTTVSEYEFEYVYDDNGNEICEDTYKIEEGTKTLLKREEKEYNENNKLTSKDEYGLSGDDLVLNSRMLGEYNENNDPLGWNSYDVSGDEVFLNFEHKIEYDDRGEVCYKSMYYEKEHRLIEYFYEHEYDASDNLTYFKETYRDTIYFDTDKESSLDRISEIYYYY